MRGRLAAGMKSSVSRWGWDIVFSATDFGALGLLLFTEVLFLISFRASLSQCTENSRSNGLSMIGDRVGHLDTFGFLLNFGCLRIKATFFTSSLHWRKSTVVVWKNTVHSNRKFPAKEFQKNIFPKNYRALLREYFRGRNWQKVSREEKIAKLRA